MANNNANQRQAFTRQELDGMTASQYLLAAGALPPTVATYLQGGAQGLRGQYQSLFDAPVKRELREAANRDSNSLGIKKLEMNIISMLLYVAGVPAEKSCRHRVKDKETDHCQTFWAGCIVAPEGEMKKETRGACANCFYNGNHTRCHFYKEESVDADQEAGGAGPGTQASAPQPSRRAGLRNSRP
ncbi:hypothetical protein G7054_g12989 [Neopestalotiopsis clavispora]|nr:hypothetical protein G7054_g12989 [Neopestalotiopsis clavispora]